MDDFRTRGDIGSVRHAKSRKSEAVKRSTRRLGAEIMPNAKPNLRTSLIRDQMIDKAAALFYADGYAQTTMNDIASGLDLSRSSVYYYFNSKEEVLTALIEREAQAPYDAIMKLYEDPALSATDRLREVVAYGIKRRLSGEPQFLVLSRLEAEGMPDHLSLRYNASKRQILDLHIRMVTDGIESGEFRQIDPKLAAFAIIGMANWTSWWFLPSGAWTPQQIGEMIVDFALFGLARRDHDDSPANNLDEAFVKLRQNLDSLERLAGSDVSRSAKRAKR